MLDIRPIRDEEFPEYVALGAYAFLGGVADQADVEEARRHMRPEWTLAAFEGGRLKARMNTLPLTMRLNGAGLPMGGVAGVCTWPEERRRGLVNSLLRRALETMKERGQVVSMLFPSFYAVYQKLGWSLASYDRSCTFSARDLEGVVHGQARGRFERISADGWALLDGVYRRFIEGRNGYLERDEAWWRRRVLSRWDEPLAAALWRDGHGEPQAYVVYRLQQAEHAQEMRVRELVGVTPEACDEALRFLARHDLALRITWSAPEDDPLAARAHDPRALGAKLEPSFMLRVVDIAAALSARPCPGVDQPLRLVLSVRDEAAPWNDGSWLVEAEAGRAQISRTTEEADLSTGAGALSALFNGFLSPRAAVQGGLLEASPPAALAAAERLFAVTHRPHSSDYF